MFTVKICYHQSENHPDTLLISTNTVEIALPDSEFSKSRFKDLTAKCPMIITDSCSYPIEGRNVAFIMNESGATIEKVRAFDFT